MSTAGDKPPSAVCPDCQRATILATPKNALFTTEKQGNIVIGHLFGEYTYLARDCQAICNSASCNWSGLLREALDAAEGVTPSTRGNLRVWVKEET